MTITGHPESQIVQPGSTVETAPGASAVLYFSDGSITYLDGDSELRLLPNSSVDQNNKDGIITKIRLKLLRGEVWNKVVRLASESQFNIETTSAIAGVRGTEFGFDKNGNLIIRSGEIAIRALEPGESGASDDFIDFDSTDSSFGTGNIIKAADSDNFEVVDKYSIPEESAGGTINPDAYSDPASLKEKYYKGAFNNSYRPRILEINTTVLNSEKVVFEYLEGVKKIIAVDSDGNSMGTWDNAGDAKADSGKTTLTIDPTNMTGYSSGGSLVQFRFSASLESVTGLSAPAVFVGPSLKLAEEDIYNMFAQETNVSGSGPAITTAPTSVDLATQHTIQSDQPCDWSIAPGSIGILDGTTTNVQTVVYKSLDDQVNMDARIAAVQTHFTGSLSSPVNIICENGSGQTQVTIVVNYQYIDTSPIPPTGTGYRYSWFAKGSTDWYEAQAYCSGWSNVPTDVQSYLTGQGYTSSSFPGLTEGGYTDWKLPSQVEYDKLDGTLNNNITSSAEGILWCGNWTGSECDKMPDGVASMWLEEEDSSSPSDAWNIEGVNLIQMLGILKTDNNTWRGFRCVR